MATDPTTRRGVLTNPAIWRRGLTLGLPVGALQVCVNQGDVWLRGAADSVVVVKTILSPLIAVGIAVASAAWAEAGRAQRTDTAAVPVRHEPDRTHSDSLSP